jgi:hypothetical protein
MEIYYKAPDLEDCEHGLANVVKIGDAILRTLQIVLKNYFSNISDFVFTVGDVMTMLP